MNGWTPTPRNAERLEHDRNQREIWEAATLAYLFEQENRPTEADADRLHELIEEALSYESGLPFLALSDTVSIAVTPRPTYDELIHGAKFTDEHRAELHKEWNEKYSDTEVQKRLNVTA